MTDGVWRAPAGGAVAVEVHEMPFTRGTNAAARALLGAFLERQQLGTRLRQDAALVLGELVANGLDHGCPDGLDGLEVSWHITGGQLRLSVTDGGGHSVPHVESPDSYSPRGRGLAMVEALSASWWVERAQGTRVTAVLTIG